MCAGTDDGTVVAATALLLLLLHELLTLPLLLLRISATILAPKLKFHSYVGSLSVPILARSFFSAQGRDIAASKTGTKASAIARSFSVAWFPQSGQFQSLLSWPRLVSIIL